MDRGLTLSLVLLGAACAMLSAPAIHAQQASGPVPCESPPTESVGKQPPSARQKVYVVKVSYDGGGGLPESVKAQLTRHMEATHLDAVPGWPSYYGERLEQALQNDGYYKAVVRPHVGVISSGSMGEQVWLTFHITEGLQYRVEQVQLVHPHVFPIAELRNQFPLQGGDIFDMSKLRVGIAALTALYEAHGYINCVVTPDIHADGAHKLVSIILQFDEGHQFKVGSVRILGLGHQASTHGLRLEMKPGMVFTRKLARDFFKLNKSLLPAGASRKKNTTITQDARNHTVAILFDFRACPETTKTPVAAGPVSGRKLF